MPIKPILETDPTSLKQGTSLDYKNDEYKYQQEALEQDLKQVQKPYPFSTAGSSPGNPVGTKRKYFDKNTTEFGNDGIDTLRQELSLKWTRKGFTKNTFTDFGYSVDTSQFTNTFDFVSQEFGFPIQVKVEPLSFEDDQNNLFRRKERVFIKISKQDFNQVFGTVVQNTTFFDWFSEKLPLDTWFSDNPFEMSLPMNKRVVDNSNFSTNVSTAEIKGNYNYEIPNYEKQIANIDERLIQNIYALFSAIEYSETSKNPSLEGYIKHATLDGKVDTVLKDLLTKNQDFDFRDAAYSLYLEAWSRATKILKSTPDGVNKLNALSEKFKHLVFPHSEKELFSDFGKAIELFPMYVEMEMSTDATSPMSTALEEMKLSLAMMTFLIIDELGTKPVNHGFIEVQESSFEQGTPSLSISETTRDSWNLISWFLNYKKIKDPSIFLEALEEDIAFLGDGEFEFKVAMTPENDLYRKLLFTIFESKLRSLVKDNFRSYKQILAGNTSSSETLVYKIDKWSVTSDGSLGQKLQSFWIPNTGDVDVVRLYDTQVKYGVPYVYKINCFQLVYGTNYKYESVLAHHDGLYDDDTHYTYQMTVESVPSVKLWEVPYYNLGSEETLGQSLEITRIVDDPPIFPDAQFVPFIGASNKILINLNTNNGEYQLEPKVINLTEVEDWQKIAEAQYKELTFNSNLEQFSNTLTFESDDLPQSYEIYRIGFKPTKYSDFSDGLLTTLTPPISSFIDNINSNVKYWYTFRIKDSHNHYSNPTDVFEVRMVENSGIVYPEIKVKSIEELRAEVQPKVLTKDVQKYIQIKPSVLQRYFEPEYSEEFESAMDVTKPEIGVQDLSVFDNGKKFKIRITSKHTGRKIDINLNFTHSHQKGLFNKQAGKK